MPLDVARLRDSEIAALDNAEAFRAAVMSWCAAWHQIPAASLPNDDSALCRLLGYGRDLRTWKKLRAAGALRGWVECSDGRLYHFVVAEKAMGAWIEKLLQRLRSAAGNAKRWGIDFDPEETNAEIDVAYGMLAAINPKSRALAKRKPTSAKKGVLEGVPKGHAEGLPEPSLNDPKGQGQGQGQGNIEDDVVEAREPDDDRTIDPGPETADPATILIAEFDDARAAAFGETRRRPWPSAQDLPVARRWLEAGADATLCRAVFDASMQRSAAANATPPETLKYFDAAVANAIAAAKNPMPEGRAPAVGRKPIRRIV